VLVVRSLLLALLLLPSITSAQEEIPYSACAVVTPSDAPYACLEVIPPGASAWITFDGKDLGLSPLGIPDIEPGPHTLRLDRLGDAPVTYRFDLQPAEIRRFDAPFTRLPPIVLPDIKEPYPLAVMVENSPDARPQAGLDKADVVYEALAEGGISRFMAVYMTHEAEVIGPVRSTRHYFVYTAAEYNSALVFVGASPIGYAALAATRIRTVNESMGDPGVWRSTRRAAPHNAFTGTFEARTAADELSPAGPGSWGPVVFKDPTQLASGEQSTKVRIRYPPLGYYDVDYTYDPDTNRYQRVMDGYRHRDYLTGEQLAATNVVIQVVPDEVIDREGRLDLAQTGEGRAYYFMDGVAIEGSWSKASYGSRTFFWDTAGNLIRFNPGGTTWIQLVPPEGRISFLTPASGT
jgi:hypothetical protein